jgi:hypothetical protein
MLIVAAAGIAFAQNPHFVGPVTASIDQETGVLKVCFKEAGLGSFAEVSISAGGTASATYVCVNNGGQCPNAANKTTVTAPTFTTETFTATKSGQVTACEEVSPPGAGTFTCPSGQTLMLAAVSFTGISVIDNTNHIQEPAQSTSLSVPDLFVCP